MLMGPPQWQSQSVMLKQPLRILSLVVNPILLSVPVIKDRDYEMPEKGKFYISHLLFSISLISEHLFTYVFECHELLQHYSKYHGNSSPWKVLLNLFCSMNGWPNLFVL